MSKNKIPQKQQSLSPEKYIRQRARNLPVAECLITPEWKDAGECNIVVARRHNNGNYTLGYFLVDTYCLGVKNADYEFNIDEYEYENIKKKYADNFEPVTYNEAHNIVYGALAYASDLGFRPHKNFEVAQYILEEDTDDIPLIEYEFGCDGRPFLIVNTIAERNRYLPALKKAVGNDYDVYVYEEDGEDECEEAEDEALEKLYDKMPASEKKDLLERFNDFKKQMEKSKSLPHTPYKYQYPDYPQILELKHKELETLFNSEYNNGLEKYTLDAILALPRETLIADLEHCILYETGQNCREISEKNNKENLYGTITHAFYLLAELKAVESLPVVLEVMRQNENFLDFFFCDSANDIIVPVLYQLANNQLPILLSYIKEPDLNPFFKIVASNVFEMVLKFEPERRAEIIAIYEDLLDFLYEKIDDADYYDADIAGVLMCGLMHICAKELLTKIKRLFDTGLVDELSCGNYNEVEEQINAGIVRIKDRYTVESVYEIYR